MDADQRKRRLVSDAETFNCPSKRSPAKRRSVLCDDSPSTGIHLVETASDSQDIAIDSGFSSLSKPKPKQEEQDTYIALLRGVNVGSHNRLSMVELRTLLSGLGYADVRTYLQSGNAVVTTSATPSEKLGSNIAEKMKASLCLTVSVMVRNKLELEETVLQNPFKEEAEKDGSKLLVIFLPRPIAAAHRGLDNGSYLPERVSFGHREVYLWCPNGVGAAKHGMGFWEKRLGMAGTARNWNTVTKLLKLLAS